MLVLILKSIFEDTEAESNTVIACDSVETYEYNDGRKTVTANGTTYNIMSDKLAEETGFNAEPYFHEALILTAGEVITI